MKVSALLTCSLTLAGFVAPVLAETRVDYCTSINENFAKGACDDPVTGQDGIIRESCSDRGDKAVCTRADRTIYGYETLDIETHPDGSFKEHTCTHFTRNAEYSLYCTTVETCAHREGVCDFSVQIDDQDCKVKIETCEDTGVAEGRASSAGLQAPVVQCSFDPRLYWNGCKEKRSSPDGMGLHGSFMSVVLADPSFASSGIRSPILFSAVAAVGLILLEL